MCVSEILLSACLRMHHSPLAWLSFGVGVAQWATDRGSVQNSWSGTPQPEMKKRKIKEMKRKKMLLVVIVAKFDRQELAALSKNNAPITPVNKYSLKGGKRQNKKSDWPISIASQPHPILYYVEMFNNLMCLIKKKTKTWIQRPSQHGAKCIHMHSCTHTIHSVFSHKYQFALPNHTHTESEEGQDRWACRLVRWC